MIEPLAFAARLLARHGALVEERDGRLESVLPPELAGSLGVPEAVTLAMEERPGTRAVTYGSELLERMIGSATRGVPVAAARLPGSTAREASAVSAVEQRFVLRNGVFAVNGAYARVGTRLLLYAAYVLRGDERREGLAAVALSARTVTPVPGGERISLDEMEPAPWHRQSAAQVESLLPAALASCAADAEVQTMPYREALERRLARDRERIDSYFRGLESELERRKGRRGTAPDAIGEKRAAIAREREAKIEALTVRYNLRIEIRPIATVLFETPVVLVNLGLKRRKGTRTLELEYDGRCRALVPPACEHCRGPAPRPAACDDEMHLLCETCAPKAEGRLSCPACLAK